MKIETLELAGWMPFRDQVLLVLPEGPIAIVGTHSQDPRRSNRAGKTSLLEAVTWCLFGTHRKRLDDAVINQSADSCYVKLRLGEMTVSRSRKRGHSTKLNVQLHGTDFTGNAAEAHIVMYLGLGQTDYLATLCFRQGDVESIVSRTAGERLALVGEWLQLSRWLDAKRLQSAKTNLIVQDLSVKRETIRHAGAEELQLDQRAAITAELHQLIVKTADLKLQMAGLRDAMKRGVEAEQVLQQHADLEELRGHVETAKNSLIGGSELKKRLQESEQLAQDASHETKVAQLEHDELASMQVHGFDGKCPVTCEDCPAADHVSEVVRVADDLLKERKATLALRRLEESSANVVMSHIRADAFAQERKLGAYKTLVQRGKQIAASISMTKEQANSAPAVAPLYEAIAEVEAEQGAVSHRIGELEATLANADRGVARFAEMKAEASKLELKAQVAQLALRAISSVPARIAAEQISELEREANMLLSGSGVTLGFSWQRELADKSPLCEECGAVYKGQRGDKCPVCEAPRGKKVAQELELLCDDGSGSIEDVRFNSGGTKALVGSAIRLAASSMLRRLRATEAAWAIVDEPFGSLDAENREQLARTFAGMLGSVGFEQALVVSHDPLLLGALPHRILVDKDGSTSTARLE